ncbi:MAG: hypothetical protein AAGF25_12165, partial [Pseudomonadota bacterium]
SNVVRVSNEADNMNQTEMVLSKFLELKREADYRKFDTASLTLSKELRHSLPCKFPPIEITNLYDGWHEKLGLDLAWLIIGFAGAFNPLHTDVWSTSTWNLLLSGRKEWVIVGPTGSPEIQWVQLPGEVMHIPSDWAHSVAYNEDSVSITENYVQPELAHRTIDHQCKDGLDGLSHFTQKLLFAHDRVRAEL